MVIRLLVTYCSSMDDAKSAKMDHHQALLQPPRGVERKQVKLADCRGRQE